MRNFFDRFRYKLSVFMNGRYGADGFNTFLLYTLLVLVILNLFFKSSIVSMLELLVISYSIFRMFSRNFTARRKENDFYFKAKRKVLGIFSLFKEMIRDRKTHVFKKCPSCHAVLRFPRKPGDHTACCPKCGHRFDVHVR